jgi:EpsI family protein
MDSNESALATARRSDVWWLFGVVIALLLLYAPTILSFYNGFSEEGSETSHAPLLLLVSLYLLYRAWSQSGRPVRLHFNRLAIVALVGLSLIWLVLGLVFVDAGQQAILVLILALVTIGMLGIRQGSRYLMPILLLLTVVPVWNVFTPYLQSASSQASAYLLDLTGITSTREGYLLVIPNGTFEVTGSCSGLKFQIAGITLALIHTQLIKVPFRVMLPYVMVASLLALVSNVVRIFVVVLVGYHYGMDNEYVQDHNFIGWILFAIFFFLFLYVGERKLKAHEIPPETEERVLPETSGPKHKLPGAVSVVVALSVGPILYGYVMHHEQVNAGNGLNVLNQLPGWQLTEGRLRDWKPIWTSGDRTIQGMLSASGERLDLYATEFLRQRQGREAVNLAHRVYDIEKWSRISRSARVVEILDVGEVEVEETLLKSHDQRKRLVWLWYRSNGEIAGDRYQAKLNNLLGVISGEPEITVFVVSREIVRDPVHAAQVLESFLKTYLAQVGGSE